MSVTRRTRAQVPASVVYSFSIARKRPARAACSAGPRSQSTLVPTRASKSASSRTGVPTANTRIIGASNRSASHSARSKTAACRCRAASSSPAVNASAGGLPNGEPIPATRTWWSRTSCTSRSIVSSGSSTTLGPSTRRTWISSMPFSTHVRSAVAKSREISSVKAQSRIRWRRSARRPRRPARAQAGPGAPAPTHVELAAALVGHVLDRLRLLTSSSQPCLTTQRRPNCECSTSSAQS